VSVFGAANKRGREEEAADDAESGEAATTETTVTGTVKLPGPVQVILHHPQVSSSWTALYLIMTSYIVSLSR
jgi:hypothetical protein